MTDTGQKSGRGHHLATVLRFFVSFGAIAVIVYMFRAQLPAVISNLGKTDPFYFLAAVFIYFFGLIFTAVRLQLVLRAHAFRLPFLDAYYVNIIALFFNNILPSSMGGEMVKAYYLYRSTNGRVTALSAVVIDRLFGLAVLTLMGAAAVFLVGPVQVSSKILISLATIGGVTGCVAFFIFNGKVVEYLCRLHVPLLPGVLLDKLRETYQAMHQYRDHKEIMASCLLLTAVGQTSYVFVNFLLSRSLLLDIPLSFFFFFIPILLVMALAPSVNGIGVREAIFLFYLAEFATPDKALALSLLTTFFMVLMGLLAGIVYAFKGGLQSAPENDAPLS
ncbi:MAG: hypothetical protein A2521_11680 [Deltaproteobacteria bacterium RIFOXYD12_FULL_57_12]|nr:MAG: hypothetical protein A2521_11680 [Deltaproteobacteria bacterium RIFOXYD12_FULL_57_12]